MRLLFLLITVCICVSCSKDDNVVINNDQSLLEDEWEMTSYVAFVETLPEFDENEIVWNFETSNNTLTVNNTIESKYPYLLKSGIYDILIFNNIVAIKSNDYEYIYDYIIEDNTLTLTAHQNEGEPKVSDTPIRRFNRK